MYDMLVQGNEREMHACASKWVRIRYNRMRGVWNGCGWTVAAKQTKRDKRRKICWYRKAHVEILDASNHLEPARICRQGSVERYVFECVLGG